MTTQSIPSITNTNYPEGEVILHYATGNTQYDNPFYVKNAVFFEYITSTIFGQATSLILPRLAQILPQPMSSTHVQQLRTLFPQPEAKEDQATHEFETKQE